MVGVYSPVLNANDFAKENMAFHKTFKNVNLLYFLIISTNNKFLIGLVGFSCLPGCLDIPFITPLNRENFFRSI